jgi:aminoglycoside phosphotransferase family enzyme
MIDQKQIVEALMKPEGYEEDPDCIELVQTHISFVFLTSKFVYKVKKAVDLGFLDFTTLEKRRFFCKKELELNRRLCRDMYLEVVPINKSNIIKIKGEGETVEYAVKMKRIPQNRIMSKLLEKNKVDTKLVREIAEIIAHFHSKAERKRRKRKHNLLPRIDPIVEVNWKENFDQTKEFVGKTISMKKFKLIHERIEEFVDQNLNFFEERMAEGRVRYCHGDIHSGNIFIADRIYIFDAIEFNDRIRYSDVTADVGFLAMDLDFRKRGDLSEAFIKNYVKFSGDKKLTLLLPFYKCYRAYVRGKVISFKLKDRNMSDHEKDDAMKEAKAYFELAEIYAKKLS